MSSGRIRLLKALLLAAVLLALGASGANAAQFLPLPEARHEVGLMERSEICKGWINGYRIRHAKRVSPIRVNFEVREFGIRGYGKGSTFNYRVDAQRWNDGVRLTSPLYANPLSTRC